MARGPTDVMEILEAARAQPTQAAPGGYSPLFVWLWARYDTLAPTLDGPHAPNWSAMAARFAELGVMAGTGLPPTAETVRKTWGKVSRWKANAPPGQPLRRRRRGPKPASVSQEPAPARAEPPATALPPTTPPAARPVASDDDDDASFGFAGGTRFGKKD